MSNAAKGKIIKTIALFIDVAPPLGATLALVPVWVQHSSEATMSGLFLILASLSCLPFLKQIKEFLKSPSAWAVWVILFVVFSVVKNIADQMVIICFAGMVSNIVGAGVYKIGEAIEKKTPKSEVKKND